LFPTTCAFFFFAMPMDRPKLAPNAREITAHHRIVTGGTPVFQFAVKSSFFQEMVLRAFAGMFLSSAALYSQSREPDSRQGEAAAAAVRPLAVLFGSSETDSFRKAVSAIPDLQVFEGLPDPKTESVSCAKEITRGDVMRVGNFSFYTEPLPLGQAELAELRAVFDPGNPFSPGGGQDPCGRFHPDYLLVWKSGETTFSAQIGLGCEEIEALGPSLKIHRYIPPDIYARLNRILGKYTVNRPQPPL
jgi:hypothetical protein